MDTIASLHALRRTTAARTAVALLFTALLTPAFAQSTGPDGATIDTRPDAVVDLAPGDYRWMPELSPAGPVVIVVSLPEQRMHVYRGGVRIGVASVSTGREDKPTPTGIFPILQKEVEHHSNLYDDAPMPYMQRLTWDGIALHEGNVPGYPASHGCIRMPDGFAEALFAITEPGTVVVVADELSNSAAVVQPGDMAPVDAYTGLEPGQAPPLPELPVTPPPTTGAVATN